MVARSKEASSKKIYSIPCQIFVTERGKGLVQEVFEKKGETMARYIDAEKIPYTDLNADMPTSKVRVYVAFKERVDRIPTADVRENVHGEWTSKETFFDDLDVFVCSNCKMRFATRDLRSWNYCPKCGADTRRTDEIK